MVQSSIHHAVSSDEKNAVINVLFSDETRYYDPKKTPTDESGEPAAKRQKITEIIMPEANQRDHNELPDYILKGMKVSFASHYDDVVNIIFDKS